jgi:organic hydroperoxide reductase OsmC/OhrA
MDHAYTATVLWQRGDQPFLDNKFSRGHEWIFDGGVTVPGSSSPVAVRPPLSREDAVDPEEALVAALSSCHMLFFLTFAAKAGIRVDRYEDAASGVMARNASGKIYLAKVTLRPALTVSGTKQPTAEEIAALHHRAHDECYIANSVLTKVTVEPGSLTFATS